MTFLSLYTSRTPCLLPWLWRDVNKSSSEDGKIAWKAGKFMQRKKIHRTAKRLRLSHERFSTGLDVHSLSPYSAALLTYTTHLPLETSSQNKDESKAVLFLDNAWNKTEGARNQETEGWNTKLCWTLQLGMLTSVSVCLSSLSRICLFISSFLTCTLRSIRFWPHSWIQSSWKTYWDVGFWLWLDQTPGVVSNWGMKQQVRDLSLCPFQID